MRYILLAFLLAGCASPTCSPPRDKHGRIERSHQAVREFKRTHVCPATGRIEDTCYGYVVDHITPLACACNAKDLAKLDRPENMQWQSISEARQKDRWERKACP